MRALAGSRSYKEMRKFAVGTEAGSTSRAGGVDPQSPTLGFLSDHRCTFLESAYHSDTLKSVAFQCKPTPMGVGEGGGGEAVLPPSSSKAQEARADCLQP